MSSELECFNFPTFFPAKRLSKRRDIRAYWWNMTICQWVSCLPLTKWELQWDHRSTHVGQRPFWRISYLANRRKVFLVKSNWQVLVMVIMEEFDSECVWMESRVCKKCVWKAFPHWNSVYCWFPLGKRKKFVIDFLILVHNSNNELPNLSHL